MKKMIYPLRVSFGDGRYANGTYCVEAYSEHEAVDIALAELCEKFHNAFPELKIDISVEIIH